MGCIQIVSARKSIQGTVQFEARLRTRYGSLTVASATSSSSDTERAVLSKVSQLMLLPKPTGSG